MRMRTLTLLVTLALAALAPGCTAESGPPDAPAPLRVGMEAAFPPFEEKTADGAIIGFDVDLLNALGEHLGRPVQIEDLPFDSLLLKLGAGDLDLVCSGLSRTDERARVVDFSEPYLRVPMGVLMGVEKARGIERAEQLDAEGIVLAVQRGTTGAAKAEKRFPNAELRRFDTEVDAASEMLVGRAHAFVYDIVSVHRWHAKNPDTTRVLNADLGSEDYSIALQKDSPLVAAVNAFLEEAGKPGGKREEIERRWLPEPERFRLGR